MIDWCIVCSHTREGEARQTWKGRWVFVCHQCRDQALAKAQERNPAAMRINVDWYLAPLSQADRDVAAHYCAHVPGLTKSHRPKPVDLADIVAPVELHLTEIHCNPRTQGPANRHLKPQQIPLEQFPMGQRTRIILGRLTRDAVCLHWFDTFDTGHSLHSFRPIILGAKLYPSIASFKTLNRISKPCKDLKRWKPCGKT